MHAYPGSKIVGYLCFLLSMSTYAQTQDYKTSTWSVTPLIGAHEPVMDLINNKVFNTPLVLRTIIDVGPLNNPGPAGAANLASRAREYKYDHFLPPLTRGSEAGVEFQWRMNPVSSFTFAISAWESSSSSIRNDNLAYIPLQQARYRTSSERRARLSYTQFYVGWRRDFSIKPRKLNFYVNVSLHEFFDVDYQDRIVFKIGDKFDPTTPEAMAAPDLRGQKKIFILKAQTTGAFAGMGALGLEYFITPWFSLGLEGGYYKSLNNAPLQDFSFEHNLSTRNNLLVVPQDIPNIFEGFVITPGTIDGPFSGIPGQPVNYYEASGGINVADRMNPPLTRPLTLDFSGWRGIFRINFYF